MMGGLRVGAVVAACAVAVAAGLAVSAPAGADVGARKLTCAYLDDGAGAGNAASPLPGVTPAPGDSVLIENTGAWRVCYAGGSLSLSLLAIPGDCYADNSHTARVRSCNGNADQQWTTSSGDGGTRYRNVASGDYLCASDGVGGAVVTSALSGCSAYHRAWVFSSSP